MWDTMRQVIAFLVAPLVVPLLFLAVLYLSPSPTAPFFGTALFISGFIAYVGIFMFGIPIYEFLRARNLTAFWIAPAAGVVVGAIMMYVFFVLLGLFFGSSISDTLSDFGRPDVLLFSLGFGAPAGAAVGATFWLIARPDRRTHRQSCSGQSEG
jgi:hypothetical protein